MRRLAGVIFNDCKLFFIRNYVSTCMLGLTLVLFFWGSASAQTRYLQPVKPIHNHPRLFVEAGSDSHDFGSDSLLVKLDKIIISECNKIISDKPVVRELIGKRLLDKSREALRRLFFLSYAWRTTKDVKYLRRAEMELLCICRFSDWNPSHFLDVAEMTLGVSIAYDWLYSELSESTKILIRQSIYEKGLRPSMDARYNDWLKMKSNWNQVCNASIGIGAIAVYESYPEVANFLINRSITSIKIPMSIYSPDGAYPEGYNYWGYGTTFNTMFLSVLQTNFKSDFGLSKIPGFLKTGYYMLNMVGPTGIPFNYGDSDLKAYPQPAMFWFSKQLGDLSLLWHEIPFLKSDSLTSLAKERLLPLIISWASGVNVKFLPRPRSTFWVGHGVTPVALMRSSWDDKNAIFVGIKGGGKSVSHGHLDMGSFVLDAFGERWAMDLGMQNYESLESKGIDLWNMKRTSQRWKIFRLNNFSHNTLSINGYVLNSDGFAPITRYQSSGNFKYAQVNLKDVYPVTLTSVKRGIGIIENSYIIQRDELRTSYKAVKVRWSMVTDADVSKVDGNKLWLDKNGKQLLIEVLSPKTAKIQTWSTKPVTSFDEPNPGTKIVGFEYVIRAKSSVNIAVVFRNAKGGAIKMISDSLLTRPLNKWP